MGNKASRTRRTGGAANDSGSDDSGSDSGSDDVSESEKEAIEAEKKKQAKKAKKKAKKDANRDYTATQTPDTVYKVVKCDRPYVTREHHSNESGLDSHNVNTLPLGCKLHGVLKLREAKLTGKNMIIGIIDTGIDASHPGFHNKVVKKQWYKTGDLNNGKGDDHGTHVAGTIHFMAPDAMLYDYKCFGDGQMSNDEAIARGIRQAVDDGCHLINISLRISFPIVKELKKSVKYAYDENVTVVCSYGNTCNVGDDPMINEMYSYPARWEYVVGVAATNKNSYGLPIAPFTENNPEDIDYVGVGTNVLSLKPNGGSQYMTGTSMSGPHVCGLLACMLQKTYYRNMSREKFYTEINDKFVVNINKVGKEWEETNNQAERNEFDDSELEKIAGTGNGFITFLDKKEFNELWNDITTKS